MKFITLLIVLSLMQYWGSSRYLHRDQWYQSLLNRLSSWQLPAAVLLTLAVVLPSLLVAGFLDATRGWLFGLFGLAANVVLLLYCLGRGDFAELVKRYRQHCLDGDIEGAFLLARSNFPAQPGEDEPADAERLHRWIKLNLAYMAFERWFAVIFYFVLFGAGGALAYRLLHLSVELCEGAEWSGLQRKVLHIVDWLPARMLVFSFALTGDYMGSREQVTSSIQDLDTSAGDIISDAAHAALGLKSTVFSDNGDVEAFAQISDWEVGQLQGLLSRSAIAWILVVSLLILLL